MKYTINTPITITASPSLTQMKLSDLVGGSGVIVEELIEGRKKEKGCMVLLAEPYQGEYLWFVPLESILADEG